MTPKQLSNTLVCEIYFTDRRTTDSEELRRLAIKHQENCGLEATYYRTRRACELVAKDPRVLVEKVSEKKSYFYPRGLLAK